MADVFISYAREDRDTAGRIAAALAERGYSVWWDWNLVGGQDFRSAIEQELDRSRRVIVLWSDASTRSGFVIDEAARAREQGKLVPVSVGGARAPLGFGDLHTIPFVPGPQSIDVIVEGLRGAPAPPGPVRRAPRRPPALHGVAIAACLALAGGGTFLFLKRHSASRFEPIPFSYQATPGFDCEAYARLPEGHLLRVPQTDIMCHDIRAADADRRMSEVFHALRVHLHAHEAAELRTEQVAWLGLRIADCPATFGDLRTASGALNLPRISQLAECIRQRTDVRTAELAGRLAARRPRAGGEARR